MLFSANVNYLNVKKKEGVKDPTKTYYSINVFDGVDCCNLNATEDVANKVSGLVSMTPVQISCDYNSQFNTLRVVDVINEA